MMIPLSCFSPACCLVGRVLSFTNSAWRAFDGNIWQRDAIAMSEDPDLATANLIAARFMLDRVYSDVYAFRVWVWSNWAANSRNMSIWVSPTEVRTHRLCFIMVNVGRGVETAISPRWLMPQDAGLTRKCKCMEGVGQELFDQGPPAAMAALSMMAVVATPARRTVQVHTHLDARACLQVFLNGSLCVNNVTFTNTNTIPTTTTCAKPISNARFVTVTRVPTAGSEYIQLWELQVLRSGVVGAAA